MSKFLLEYHRVSDFLAVITSNSREKEKPAVRRECRRHSIRKQSRSPKSPSLADIVGFLSQDCTYAIDRTAVARPLSPYFADLGHFDVRSMRLTY